MGVVSIHGNVPVKNNLSSVSQYNTTWGRLIKLPPASERYILDNSDKRTKAPSCEKTSITFVTVLLS